MKRVTLVGLGPGGAATLTLGALEALAGADLVIGAARLLEQLPADCTAKLLAEARPEAVLKALAREADWQQACLVLSGDIGFFSGAKKLLAALDQYEVTSLPGVSSVQYLAARLGRPWQDWRFASAHGMTCDLAVELAHGAPLFLVTGGAQGVADLCHELCTAGFAEAEVTVGERLSYAEERVCRGTARELVAREFDALSVMLVEAPPAVGAWPYASSGLPDALFARAAAPMTKQEVRAVALAKLRVAATDTLYDIGAGTGSVAVELALRARAGRVYAVEQKPEALALIAQNAAKFGARNLQVVAGVAPAALAGLPPPDAAFIGGSGGRLAEILAALKAANPLLRLCVACVTLETLNEAVVLLQSADYTDFEVCQIAASRSQALGSYQMLAALNPVFLVSARGVVR